MANAVEWSRVTLEIPVPAVVESFIVLASGYLQRVSLVHVGAVGIAYLLLRTLLQR